MKSNTVGARELKIRLGTYLRRVQQGARLVVTERGRPVAELRPISSGPDGLKTRLEQLAALGVLTLGKDARLEPFRPIVSRGPAVSAALLEDREDRF